MASFGTALPTSGTDENTIRAGLIRHIMLSGCDNVLVHAKGVQIQGAWITDVLDLQGCESPLDLALMHCHICEQPNLLGARLGSVMLPGCAVPGLDAHRLKVKRGLLLNKGFKASGAVDLSSVIIGGALECSGGRFDGALNCDAMTVGADVFLIDGFAARGLVNLRGAQISGNLQCSGAKFQGDLDYEGMTVGGGMFWQDAPKPLDVFDLTDAYVGALRDDVGSWKECIPVLNGFRYDRIISEMTVRERLDWLAEKFEMPIVAAVQIDGEPLPWLSKQGDEKFDPQPYSQLAATLRAQGNASGAARVLVAREERLRRMGYLRAQAGLGPKDAAAVWTSLLAMIKRPFDWAFGLVFGYGHQPARALVLVTAIWAFCFALYGAAYDARQMAPNSDVVLTSEEWGEALKGCENVKMDGCEMPLHLWVGKGDLKPMPTSVDYETFSRGLYALDLFVPLDALGQENAWAPSKDRGALGWWAYYLRWAVQMSGWVITAVAAAALTGVIGRKE